MERYLDHAATTPMRPEAVQAWVEAQRGVGNASSIHTPGQRARRLLEESRERLAVTVDADPVEVILTSGGTESVNTALKGLWWSRASGAERIVVPDGEHHATTDPVAWLAEAQDARLDPVPLDGVGRIVDEAWRRTLPGAALATALVANNEVGTVQDAGALCAAAAESGTPLHLDAVSAFGHVPVSFRAWRRDAPAHAGLVALSVTAHKVGGPVGVGALVVARGARLTPLMHGGGQQRSLRAGTQDVAGAAAFAVAAELAVAERAAEADRLRVLAAELAAGIRAAVPTARILGDPSARLPGNVHVLFPDAGGEELLFLLDMAGLAVSTGSACQAGVPEPSHVVLALGLSDREARSVIRISLGRPSTADDVRAIVAALPDAHARAAASRARADARS